MLRAGSGESELGSGELSFENDVEKEDESEVGSGNYGKLKLIFTCSL